MLACAPRVRVAMLGPTSINRWHTKRLERRFAMGTSRASVSSVAPPWVREHGIVNMLDAEG
jgi:hypothetical protein